MDHSASRALQLLKAMNRRAVSRVRDLAAETGISKPSVVRLLAILIEDGFVQRAGEGGHYALTRDVLELSAGFREDMAIVRAARSPMEALTAQAGWPTALGLLEQGAMVVRYSTIPSSRLSWYRTTLHQRLPLLESAMGMAFLAFLPSRERAALLSAMSSDASGSGQDLAQRFARDLSRGHAIRMPTSAHPTLSLSVPLLDGDRVIAALSMTLFGRTMAVEEAVVRYLGTLRATAQAIVAAGAS